VSTERDADAVQFELSDRESPDRGQVWVALGEAVAIVREWVAKDGEVLLERLVLTCVDGGVRLVIADTTRDWRVLFDAFRYAPSYELWFERDMLRPFDSFSEALDAVADVGGGLDGYRIEEVGRRNGVIAGRPGTLRALLSERQR